MLTSKVAKRYAQGLLDFTQESGQTDAVFAEMKDILKAMNNSPELSRFFQTPFINPSQKKEAAAQIFRDFSPVTQNLINLVQKQGRISHLQNIAQEFINKVEDLRGVQRITLTTATPLSANTVNDILKSSALVQQDRNSDLKTIVNPEILGGYILRVGDQQVDASVKSKLANIKKEFQLN